MGKKRYPKSAAGTMDRYYMNAKMVIWEIFANLDVICSMAMVILLRVQNIPKYQTKIKILYLTFLLTIRSIFKIDFDCKIIVVLFEIASKRRF